MTLYTRIMNEIKWSDFEKLDIRVGTILSAESFKKARNPSYILEIDFGPLGIKKSAAQITKHYNIQELPGKQIIAIINFPPKQIANFFSECLVLGVYENNKDVVLLSTDKAVANGLKIG